MELSNVANAPDFSILVVTIRRLFDGTANNDRNMIVWEVVFAVRCLSETAITINRQSCGDNQDWVLHGHDCCTASTASYGETWKTEPPCEAPVCLTLKTLFLTVPTTRHAQQQSCEQCNATHQAD